METVSTRFVFIVVKEIREEKCFDVVRKRELSENRSGEKNLSASSLFFFFGEEKNKTISKQFREPRTPVSKHKTFTVRTTVGRLIFPNGI